MTESPGTERATTEAVVSEAAPTATRRGVILYGPPASGKDTITRELHQLDPRYVLFPRLKVGRGRTTGYRMTDQATVDALRANGDIIWENRRYDSLYVVDRPELMRRLAEHIPVLHLGQPEAIDEVIKATPEARWLTVYVWCPRDVAEQRIKARNTGDTQARLRAWDETKSYQTADIYLNTGRVLYYRAARTLADNVSNLERFSRYR
jgi:guanylate kinase